ncbi:MAG TPA: hypothetical protein VL769_12785 [Acidimicrobiia bacterium]|nr:hypothetical protein [Acidimicrobiia bacterium]
MTTAATPKRSFKRTVASTVEERSPRFLLGSLALAMVISLLAGLGIGIKVGEHNKTKAKPAAIKPKKTPTSRPGAGSKAARPPLTGTVVRKTPRLLVISTGKARIPLILLPKTRVEVTAPAQRSDIKAGSRVLFKVDGVTTSRPATTNGSSTGATGAAPAATYTAKAILIVSGLQQGRLGSLVRSVTSDSMTFKLPNGKSLTISTAGARVSKTIPSTRAKLVAGQHVLIRWQPFAAPAKQKAKKPAKKKAPVIRKRQRVATEIVAVSATSAFA